MTLTLLCLGLVLYCTCGGRGQMIGKVVLNYEGRLYVRYNDQVDKALVGQPPSFKQLEPVGGFQQDKLLLVMVDPDTPSKPYWLHWIAIVTRHHNGDPIIDKTIVDYAKPTPPIGTGYHRYQFKFYRLPETHSLPKAPETRGRFDLQDFVKGLGRPVAETQFLAIN